MAIRIPSFPAGVKVEEVIEKLIELAKVNGTVVCNINDVDIYVEPESSKVDLMRYLKKMHQIYDFLFDNGMDSSIINEEPQ